MEAARNISLQVNEQGVVARTIVGAKLGGIWRIRGYSKTGEILVTPVTVNTLLVIIICAYHRLRIEGVLNAAGESRKAFCNVDY